MLKKVIALLLVVFCFTTTAFAEGKLKATEKVFIVCDGEGYFYAKIENVGDAAASTGYGDLVAFDDDDEIVFSTNYVSTYPSGIVLEPGESLYLEESVWENALKETPVADYKFSLPVASDGQTITRVPSEATFELTDEEYSYENYIYVTFTNSAEESISGFYISAALYDADGNLIYVGTNQISNVAIHPGSTVTAKMSIDSDMVSYYKENNITPASASAVVFYVNK